MPKAKFGPIKSVARKAATEIDTAVSGPISGPLAPFAENNEPLKTVWDEFDWTGYTQKEKLFIEFYCANPTNATQAAINAGYGSGAAASISCQMLRKPRIHGAVSKIIPVINARVGLEEQTILFEVFILMTSSVHDYNVTEDGIVTLKEGIPEYMMRAVKGVTHTTIRAKDGSVTKTATLMLWDKPSAIRMAGQYRKMFTDKVDVDVNVNVKQTWKVGDKQITF